MKKHIPLLVFLFGVTSAVLHAQVIPSIEWQKCIGGTANEAAFSVQQTGATGYIVAGYSDSNDGDVTGNHGQQDYWVVKLNNTSGLEWQKSLGGNSIDQANAVRQTVDGGYIVAGYSYSNNGDVSGNHGSSDYWVVKLDATGVLEWQKCLGGSGDDGATGIQQTIDGGFVVAGYSSSADGDVTGNHGMWDYWVAKLDLNGNIEWEKSLGGSSNDVAYAIQQTPDESYIVTGYSESADGDVSANKGARDYWIVRLDNSGNVKWETPLGGTGYDESYAVLQTADFGYVVSGFAGSSNGDVTGNHGAYDFWIVKVDSAGNLVTQLCYGGTNNDQAFSLAGTTGNGFIVAGQAFSNDGDVSGNHGGYDFWAVKLDENLALEWQKCMGGSSDEYGPYSLQQTAEGGFILSGASLSNDQDVSGNHGGSSYGDGWIVKLVGGKPTGIPSHEGFEISIFPNPVSNELTISMGSPVDVISVHVYDVVGKEVKLAANIQESIIEMNVQSLPAGFYTLRILGGEGSDIAFGKFEKVD